MSRCTGFPRYLMTGGLYPPYPSLFPAPDSLSLLGGVACVAGGGAPSPSQSAHHVAQCHRLLENMQKGNIWRKKSQLCHYMLI